MNLLIEAFKAGARYERAYDDPDAYTEQQLDAGANAFAAGRSLVLSSRGYPLIISKPPVLKPVLTVEAYMKWYTLFLVDRQWRVTRVEYDVLEKYLRGKESPFRDHTPNPEVVQRYADDNGYHFDDIASELMTARYAEEV